MHYIIEITQRKDNRWSWVLMAPNGFKMTSGLEGDGFPTPSAALRSLQDTAAVFVKFGTQILEWSAEGRTLTAGDLLKIDGPARKPGLIVRVVKLGSDGED